MRDMNQFFARIEVEGEWLPDSAISAVVIPEVERAIARFKVDITDIQKRHAKTCNIELKAYQTR